MEIKKHELYRLYLSYLDTKKMSIGARKLSEISESLFYDFLDRYENNPSFKEKMDKSLISIKREESIDELLNDGFEIILEDDLKTSLNSNLDDDFFDF